MTVPVCVTADGAWIDVDAVHTAVDAFVAVRKRQKRPARLGER